MNTDKMRTAFLFPGQGAQYPRMALDFFDALPSARELFALASSVMGTDMHTLIAESDAAALGRTDRAQIAITLANLCASAALAEEGITPCAAAGHSLGEYAALVTAGIISVTDCFTLVKARGEIMREAAEHCPPGSGMAAVLGLDGGVVEQLISGWRKAGLEGLYAANVNSPRQTVVSGTAAALAEAETRFKEAGARRVVRLAVQGPFHSPLMEESAACFSAALEPVAFHDPHLPFFSNVSGARITHGEEARALAVKHITNAVRWTDSEAALAALGIDAVCEAGPGTVLCGLWKDSGISSVAALPAGTVAAVKAASLTVHGGTV